MEPEDERELSDIETAIAAGAEIPVDKEKFPYDRGDISFEMKLFD